MALVGKTGVGSDSREVALASREALQRVASAESHPLTRDRHAGDRPEHAAQMMWRDAQRSCETRKGLIRIGCQGFSRTIGQRRPGTSGGRPPGGDPVLASLLGQDGSLL